MSALSRIGRNKIRTFAFLDMESTGSPFREQNRTRMTELSIGLISADHMTTVEEFPRIISKLNLNFNPRRPIQQPSTDKTGLTNELLENQPEFQPTTVNVINEFLDLQSKPLCFVAHNGNVYHYPILKYEAYKAGKSLRSYILCVDFYDACQELYKKYFREDSLAFTLLTIYDQLTSTTEYGRHRAEFGVHNLIQCVTALGIHFVGWANERAINLKDIPRMRPINECLKF